MSRIPQGECSCAARLKHLTCLAMPEEACKDGAGDEQGQDSAKL